MSGEEFQNRELEDNDIRDEKKENVFHRVKERLSMRSKKKIKEAEETAHENKIEKENIIEKNQVIENSDDVKKEKDAFNSTKKKKDGNIFQKLIRRLSFRTKKGKQKSEVNSNDEIGNNEKREDHVKENDNKSLSETSIADDIEISGFCEDDNQEKGTSPSIPVISSSRPPLPTMKRPPSSATTTQSRPVSQLDVALKQFKLSTAASRENLRSSRVDISQVEEHVKTMLTSRPSTPTPAGWRSRAPPENSNMIDQWKKLSASMTDLR